MEKIGKVISSIKLDHAAVEKLNLNMISQPSPGTTGAASLTAIAQVFRPTDSDPDKLSTFKVVITAKSGGMSTPDKKEADIFTIELVYAAFYSTLEGKTVKYADVKEASSLIGNQLTPQVYHMINDLLFKMGLSAVQFSLDMFYLNPPVLVAKNKEATKKKAASAKKKK